MIRHALAVAALASVTPLPAAAEGGGATWLQPPAQVRRAIQPCETHVYRLQMRAGETLRGFVEQDGRDLRIIVTRASDDVIVLTTNRWDGGGGRERLLVLAGETGEYVVAIHAVTELRTPSFYTLDLAPLQPTTSDDLIERTAEDILADTRRILGFQGHPLAELKALLEPALRLCQTIGAIDCQADAMMTLAHARWFATEDVRGGRDLLLASLPLRERSGDRYAEGETLNDLGVLSRWLGDLQEARDFFERVPALKKNDPLVLMNSGPVYWQLGELQKAIDTENKALEIWTESGDREGQAYALNVLGNFALQLGDTGEALRHVSQSLSLYTSAGHLSGVVETTRQMGTVYDATGERAKALQYYRESLLLAKKIFDRHGEARALLQIGKSLNATGRRDEARRSIEESIHVLRTANLDEAAAQQALADVHTSSERYTEATKAYRHVVALAEKSGNMAVRADAQLGIARIERDRGRLNDALRSLESATEIIESLRLRIANPEVRASYFSARQAHYDLTIDVLMRLNRKAEALDVSERARGRALLDSLIVAQVRDRRLDPALAAREEAIRQSLNGKATALMRMRVAQRESADAVALRREIDRLLVDHKAVRDLIARSDLAGSGAALRASEIQKLLDSETLLLEFALGDPASYLWVVGRDSLRTFALPPRATIDRLARRVVELVPRTYRRDLTAQAQLAARRLSDAILSDAAHLLQKKRLVIVADGVLQIVSFAALPDPSSPSQPLIVDHEIVALPSASLLAALRAPRERQPTKTFAVMADPVVPASDRMTGDFMRSARAFGPDAFARLPHTLEEARRIAALVPSDQRFYAVDTDATRAAVMSGVLEDFRFVHFATHGLINTEHPELSGLLLSDGFLRLADIYRMELSADLVVLSACRTALGKEVHREGLVGLTRGFITAGAPRVVASLWDVRDRATAELMERFYTRMLRDRMPPAAALRAAQLSMLRDPRYREPFYWAAFVLQGEWR